MRKLAPFTLLGLACLLACTAGVRAARDAKDAGDVEFLVKAAE
jgi:hypothetical protein